MASVMTSPMAALSRELVVVAGTFTVDADSDVTATDIPGATVAQVGTTAGTWDITLSGKYAKLYYAGFTIAKAAVGIGGDFMVIANTVATDGILRIAHVLDADTAAVVGGEPGACTIHVLLILKNSSSR